MTVVRSVLAALTVLTLSLSAASSAPDPYVISVVLTASGANAYAGQT